MCHLDIADNRTDRLTLERPARGDDGVGRIQWIDESGRRAAVPKQLGRIHGEEIGRGRPSCYLGLEAEQGVLDRPVLRVSASDPRRADDIVLGSKTAVGARVQPIAGVRPGTGRDVTGAAGYRVVARQLLFPEQNFAQDPFLLVERVLRGSRRGGSELPPSRHGARQKADPKNPTGEGSPRGVCIHHHPCRCGQDPSGYGSDRLLPACVDG